MDLQIVYSYIYLIQEREHVRLNEQVYKIGQTCQSDFKRFDGYPKNSHLILMIDVLDCKEIEKIIIKKFKTAFCHRKDYGNEYFEGNKCLMIKEIIQIVQEYNPATLLRANQKDIHKDLDLEKQKIQIEKEKIELEKQKIQIEKEKIELEKFCNSNTITNPKERGNTIIPTQSKKKKIELDNYTGTTCKYTFKRGENKGLAFGKPISSGDYCDACNKKNYKELREVSPNIYLDVQTNFIVKKVVDKGNTIYVAIGVQVEKGFRTLTEEEKKVAKGFRTLTEEEKKVALSRKFTLPCKYTFKRGENKGLACGKPISSGDYCDACNKKN